MSLSLYIYIYTIQMCVCIYIYIHVYIHIHILYACLFYASSVVSRAIAICHVVRHFQLI